MRKPSDEPKMIRLISRLLSAFRAARPRRKQRSTKTSGILFDRMSALPRATSVPFSRLARGLELMTIMVQPLQIRKRMIVTRHDVVTVIAYPVAQRRMHARLAMIVRALSNHGTDGDPVPGQPSPPVTPIPSAHARPRSTTTPAPWPTRHHEEHTQQPAPNMASTIEDVRGPGRAPRSDSGPRAPLQLGSARRPTLGRAPSTHGRNHEELEGTGRPGEHMHMTHGWLGRP